LVVKEIPFLKDGQFVLTGTNAMLSYIIERANKLELLGRNIDDAMKIDMFKSKDYISVLLSSIYKIKVKGKLLKRDKMTELKQL